MKAETSIILVIAVLAIVGIAAYSMSEGWFQSGAWVWYGSVAPTAACGMRSIDTCQGVSGSSEYSNIPVGDHVLVTREGRGFAAILPGDGYDACEVEVAVYINNVKQGHTLVYGDYLNHPYTSADGQPYGSCRLDNSDVRVDDRKIESWSSEEGYMLIEYVTFSDFEPNEDPPVEEFTCVVASNCDTYCQENQCNTPTCLGEWTCVSGECVYVCEEPEDVECYSDSNCAMGYICHDNACIPGMDPNTACYTNAECNMGFICNLNTNTCVEESDPGSTIPTGNIPITEADLPWVIAFILIVIGGLVLLSQIKK